MDIDINGCMAIAYCAVKVSRGGDDGARNFFRNMQHALGGKRGIAEPTGHKMGLDGSFTVFRSPRVILKRRDGLKR